MIKSFLFKNNGALNNSLHVYKFISGLKHFKGVWVRSNIVKNYLHALYILIKRFLIAFDFRRYQSNNKIDFENIETIIYVNSKNTFQALEFLIEEENVLVLEQSNRINLSQSDRESHVFHFTGGVLLFIPLIINYFIFGFFYWKQTFLYPNLFFENWGKFSENKKFLKRFKRVKRVVFSNDHNVENRMFKLASEDLKIETIYLQHATVTKLFPKLDFDKSFLFGEIDLNKYKDIGVVSGEVNLVGSPKFDTLFPHRKKILDDSSRIKTIGLAINKIDTTSNIYNLIEAIIKKTSYHLILRMHPGEKRKINYNSERLRVHHANTVKLTDFFGDIDFLLAGESSIHLESIYLGVPSCYVNLSKSNFSDNYDFIKSGLLKVLDDSNLSNAYFMELALNAGQTDVIKRFLASYNSDSDGRVSELVKNKIFDL